MMSTLRMQNFSIIGQGVPEIQGVTDTQTQDEDLLYRSCQQLKSPKPLHFHEFFTQKIDNFLRKCEN